MATSTFKKAGDRIKQSAFVLPVAFIFAALWFMAIGFAIEDYSTSFWGYELLPTQPGYSWTAYLIAALPSVGQIAAGYITLALGWKDEADRKYAWLSLVIWLMLFSVDAITDMFYRMNVPNPTWETALVALFQTVFIFTLGSELAFVVGFGMTIQLLPDTLAETFGIFTRVKTVWADRFGTPPQPQQPKQQKPQNQPNQQRPPQQPHMAQHNQPKRN